MKYPLFHNPWLAGLLAWRAALARPLVTKTRSGYAPGYAPVCVNPNGLLLLAGRAVGWAGLAWARLGCLGWPWLGWPEPGLA